MLSVTIYSFSFKRGLPVDESGNGGGYVFDCRSTHNPGKYDEYKQLTGLDQPVIDFLEKDGEILTFLDSVYALVDHHVERFIERDFTNLQVALVVPAGSTVLSIVPSTSRSTSTRNTTYAFTSFTASGASIVH